MKHMFAAVRGYAGKASFLFRHRTSAVTKQAQAMFLSTMRSVPDRSVITMLPFVLLAVPATVCIARVTHADSLRERCDLNHCYGDAMRTVRFQNVMDLFPDLKDRIRYMIYLMEVKNESLEKAIIKTEEMTNISDKNDCNPWRCAPHYAGDRTPDRKEWNRIYAVVQLHVRQNIPLIKAHALIKGKRKSIGQNLEKLLLATDDVAPAGIFRVEYDYYNDLQICAIENGVSVYQVESLSGDACYVMGNAPVGSIFLKSLVEAGLNSDDADDLCYSPSRKADLLLFLLKHLPQDEALKLIKKPYMLHYDGPLTSADCKELAQNQIPAHISAAWEHMCDGKEGVQTSSP